MEIKNNKDDNWRPNSYFRLVGKKWKLVKTLGTYIFIYIYSFTYTL